MICRLCSKDLHENNFFLASRRKIYDKICKNCKHDKQTQRRQDLKRKLIDLKGGKCSKCGYNKCITALEFHHSDPTVKEFNLSKNLRATEIVLKELQKCILVCANCHREIHAQLTSIN